MSNKNKKFHEEKNEVKTLSDIVKEPVILIPEVKVKVLPEKHLVELMTQAARQRLSKDLQAVSQALIANGGVDGTLMVQSTDGFRVGQRVTVSSSDTIPSDALVLEVLNSTTLKVKQQPNGTLSMAAYLTGKEAKIEAVAQTIA